MIENRLQKVYACAIGVSVDTVGGKWKPFILEQLSRNTLRFGELHRLIVPTVSQKVLTQQLKELEEDGIVLRQVYAEVPPRVEYSLTPYGRTLQPLLDALVSWGEQHISRRRQLLKHA